MRSFSYIVSKKSPQVQEAWIKAKKKYHLTEEHITMAKALGMNPRKFGNYAANKFKKQKKKASTK